MAKPLNGTAGGQYRAADIPSLRARAARAAKKLRETPLVKTKAGKTQALRLSK